MRANSNASAPSAPSEEPFRLCGGRGDELHPHIVERVDQDDEALGRVALVSAEHRNAVDEHGVEALGDLEIIWRAERLAAQVVEGKAGDAAHRLRNLELAPEEFDFDRGAARSARERQEGGVERGVGLRAERRVIHRRAHQLLEPVVGQRVEPNDRAALLEERDERQEQRAVEPVLVEVVRRDVGRRHHHHARRKQRREQAPEDHRVGDVAHSEFVEAQERRLARELGGDRGDRVLARHRADLARLPPFVQPGVDVGHEGVEMRAAFLLNLDRAEEQVHQHRLAATDRAVNVETARRLGWLRAEQPREGARLRLGPVVLEPVAKRVEFCDQRGLSGVVGEVMFVEEGAVALGERRSSDIPSPNRAALARARAQALVGEGQGGGSLSPLS